ncbi:hypothetical protein N7414_22215 [Pseudomonas sp. GD04087]|uniref:hypothetical protein n=1 Tax=Pseudomonas TaxID=286 RepID=UPI001F2FC871|nr:MULTISPECIES: hypothetical protein [Pseudomonas]MCP1651430.1 hypothetical protein [Pseudomonas nitroreducens]MCP1689344.1 hypothetical protein [Pseudomonas nitroreducens]MDH0291847.1 hypothetical protein [Pseudomonas sp. GD04087]MDH1050041.1 hypothetical protein [Pseudomonas sp. GD03903]MDH2001869.1 hypothetical protein [Pseudomonas sp. GD03691]
MLKKIFGGLLLLVTLSAIGGCVSQPTAVSKSNIAEGYTSASKSIYVMSLVGSTQPEFNTLLEKSLTRKLEWAGYQVKYANSNGLELDPDSHLAKAKEFGAQFVLVITPNGGKVMGMSNLYVEGQYRIAAVDVTLKRVVYKSQLRFWPYNEPWIMGIQWNDVSAQGLADAIYNEGHYQGLLF